MSVGLEDALALLGSGDAAAAERALEGLAPSSRGADAWFLLGAARHQLGKRGEASDAFRAALALQEDFPDAASALATVLGESGRWDEAESALRRALALRPVHAQLHFNLACILERRGSAQDALAHYDQALAADPGHDRALLNRGAMKMALGDPEAGLRDFDAILARHPGHVGALVNRNRALLLLQRDEDALAAAAIALAAHPGSEGARLGKALALASLGRTAEAQECMRPLHESWDAEAVYLARALGRQDECDWGERDRLVRTLGRRLESSPDGLQSAGLGLLHRLLALPMEGSEVLRAASGIAASLPAPMPPQRLQAGAGRIRVGFLSAGVGLHPDYYLLNAALKAMDRNRFEVLLVALNADDGSEARREMARGADRYMDLSAEDSPGMVVRMRAESLDIVVDTAGYFRAARPEVLKARIAPVQAAYLGTPCTYGTGIVDYRISDRLSTPPSVQGEWAEKLVLVPAPHHAYAPGTEPADAGTRAAHGLPPAGFVFCCFNQCWKIEPESFGAWMRVLRALPDAVLWLLDEGPRTRNNLRRAAQACGVPPTRLVFAPRVPFAAHLGRLRHADAFLDTFRCNAVTTALDTLWAGVPFVTRLGSSMASRLGAAIAIGAGLAELVACSSDDYERIARRLVEDRGFFDHCRDACAAARHGPVFDLGARVRALESALVAMVERSRAGLRPERLELD